MGADDAVHRQEVVLHLCLAELGRQHEPGQVAVQQPRHLRCGSSTSSLSKGKLRLTSQAAPDRRLCRVLVQGAAVGKVRAHAKQHWSKQQLTCGTSVRVKGRSPGVCVCSGSLYSFIVRPMVIRGCNKAWCQVLEPAAGSLEACCSPLFRHRCARADAFQAEEALFAARLASQHMCEAAAWARTGMPAHGLLTAQQVAACQAQHTSRREKLMEISFLGLSERCQYWQVATGLGSTTPAV